MTVGFIRLPSFYGKVSDDAASRSVTEDLKQVLQQMNESQVDLVVIDLRGNSGGTLTESVEAAALLIGSGPVVQAKYVTGNVETYATRSGNNRLWQGPLALLVDGLTASGAEIFAAAVQDYGAGIIIGETTNGNGSFQTLTEIGKSLTGVPNPPALGRLKLTSGRLYRVTGASNQLVGITPDVLVPSAIRASRFGERALDFPLQSDRIAAAKFQRFDLAPSQKMVAGLSARSEQRREKSAEFQHLEAEIHLIEEPQPISLKLADHQRNSGADTTEITGELPGIREITFDFELEELLRVATDYLSRVLFARGEQRLKANKVNDAVAHFRRASAADPLNSAAHYKLAWVLSTARGSGMRDGTAAVRHAQRACELDGYRKWNYLLCLAIAEAEAGEFDKAKEHLAKALDKAPADQRANSVTCKSDSRGSSPIHSDGVLESGRSKPVATLECRFSP